MIIVHVYDNNGQPWSCAKMGPTFKDSPEFNALESALDAKGFEVCLDRKVREGFTLPEED